MESITLQVNFHYCALILTARGIVHQVHQIRQASAVWKTRAYRSELTFSKHMLAFTAKFQEFINTPFCLPRFHRLRSL